MDVTLSGMVIEVKPVQPLNAPEQRYITLPGIFTEIKPVQSKNASLPMYITLFGMVTSFKPMQPENVYLPPIDFTPSSIITYLISSLGIETISVIFLFSISLPIIKYSFTTQFLSNASGLIFLPWRIATSFNPMQP